MNTYVSEVKKSWGNTAAYKEYEQKTASYSEADFKNSSEKLNSVFAMFAECKSKGNTPDSEPAQALVKELQSTITQSFYTCTEDVLKGLGIMYTADERFMENIDKHGEGTAEFISNAIELHCK